MLKYLQISILLLGFISANAQYEKIDSLQYLLVEQSGDSIKIDVYRQLCTAYTYVNFDTSLYYGQLSYDLSKEKKLFKQEALALVSMGYVHFDKGNVLESMEFFSNSFEISKSLKDTALMAKASNAVGTANWKLMRNGAAIKNFQNTHDWALQSNDQNLYECALNNLGLISAEIGRPVEAINYFAKTERLARKKKDIEGEAIAVLNIAYTYREMKKYDMALEGYHRTIEMMVSGDDPGLVAQAYCNIADVLNEQKKYQAALDTVEIAMRMCQKNGMKDLLIECLDEKTEALLGMSLFTTAIATAKEGIEKSKAISMNFFIPSFYKALSTAFEKEGNSDEALIWQRSYSTLKDSLFDLNRQKEIAQLEISFQTKQKDSENSLLKKEKESQMLIIQQRTRIAMAIGVAVVLLIIVVFQLYLVRRKTKSMNRVLEEKVSARTGELEELNSRLKQSNNELERFAFIASHDLKEPLRNMGGFISLIKRRIEQKQHDSLEEYIGFAEKNNRQMVDLVETILEYSKLDFKERAALDQTDIQKEVENVCEMLKDTIDRKNVKVHFNDLPQVQYYPSLIRIILKNLIENGIKYNKSETPTIHITYCIEGRQLKLMVSDNGIGIASKFQKKIFDMFVRLNSRSEYNGTGMGLAFCKKILMSNGGSIAVESEEGKGSTFIVKLPEEALHGVSPLAMVR